MQAVMAAGVLLRAGLLALGEAMDRFGAVKYSDIDYKVFSDGARYVGQGLLPFTRSTYRYSPLLAYAMLPNLRLPLFGKLLFCAADIAAGALMGRLMLPRRRPALLALWVLNPLVAVVSSRGSFDSLIAVALLGVVALARRGRVLLAALLFGLSAHLRIYPIFLGPTLCAIVDDERVGGAAARRFVAVSAGTFLALTALFRAAYGQTFLEESLLHHLRRQDCKHNLSVLFMLSYSQGQSLSPWLRLATGLAPLALCGLCALAHLRRPFTALFLCTTIFVSFNRVLTAQYFVWPLQFLSLALDELPARAAPRAWRELGGPGLAALGLLLLWNNLAFRFESLGQGVFGAMHWTNCLFFLANAVTIWRFSRLARLSVD